MAKYYVNALGSNTIPYDTEAKGSTTISAVVNNILLQSGDEIEVLDNGTIDETSITAHIDLPSGVILYGIANKKPLIELGSYIIILRASCILRNLSFFRSIGGFFFVPSYTNNVLVEKCYFKNNAGDFLSAATIVQGYCNNFIFRNNILDVNLSSGECIRIDLAQNAVIVNNTFVARTSAGTSNGIRMASGLISAKIINNIVVALNGSTNGISIPAGSYVNIIEDYNCIYGFSNAFVNLTAGTHDLLVDPLFLDSDNGDLSLQLNSPCIDSGVGNSTYSEIPNEDNIGNLRPNIINLIHVDDGTDIGGYEFRLNPNPIVIIDDANQRTNGSGKVEIEYTGIDADYDICHLNLYEYSLTGDFLGEEEEMTIVSNDTANDNINSLQFTFEGNPFILVWDAYSDIGEDFEGNVSIRIRANDGGIDSNIATFIVAVDTKKPIISSFVIDSNSEEEENVTINGLVDLSISCIGANSMKFSNNGLEWSSYEPYNTVKSWNLISGYGGQPFQSLKRVYIKVKDSYGNETDGLLFDTTWYKISAASVKNLTTNEYTHSISKAIEDAIVGDIIEVQSNETFFDSFIINKNNITLRNGDSFKPSIDMTDRNAITIENISNVKIYGFLLIEANDRLIEVINSDNIILQYNIFDHEYGLIANNCNNLLIDRNIFRDGYKSIELNNCTSIINNNQIIRMSISAIELTASPSKIINNHFIETYNCIDNLGLNNDSSIIRNNIFYSSNGIVINANPTWIIDHNNFWENKREYQGLVARWEEYNNFNSDPKFVNSKEDNYYLMPNSPCINTGSFKDAPDHDFNDNVRKQDINFDIGAFEYSPAPEYIFNTTNILSSNDVKNVFIYDTRKDNISNSWRSNFPEVAYLIVTEEGLYIANSDSRELFMKFEQGTDNAIDNDTELKALFALDGIVYMSNGELGGLIVIDFINDRILKITSDGTYEYDSNIADRNSGIGFSYLNNNQISGTDIRDIDVAYIDNDTYVAVATENSVCIIKNVSNIICYGDSHEINRLVLTDNARLYYIDYLNGSNNISVFYDVDEDSENREFPNYIYDTTNELGPKLFSTVINDLTVIEGDSKVKRDSEVESNTIYVATDNGINVLYTYEDTKGYLDGKEPEKWGYTIIYLLKEDYNPISEITTPNLLEINNGNHDFEDGTINPDFWTPNGYPIYSKTGNDSFSGTSAIRVCFNNSYTSDILIPIEDNTEYIFGAAIKADQFNSKVVVRVDWYDNNEDFISTTLLDIGTDIYYRKYYSNLKSPINAMYAKIVLDGDSLDTNKRFWFDNIELYEGHVNTDIKDYVLDGLNRNIDHINAYEDILLFVTKELNNDQLYLYNRYDLKLKMRRSTNLPSRNISSLYFNKII